MAEDLSRSEIRRQFRTGDGAYKRDRRGDAKLMGKFSERDFVRAVTDEQQMCSSVVLDHVSDGSNEDVVSLTHKQVANRDHAAGNLSGLSARTEVIDVDAGWDHNCVRAF
jgi:hypothetical protein